MGANSELESCRLQIDMELFKGQLKALKKKLKAVEEEKIEMQ
jgi:uncharacterized coiled-coil protein SlyX